MKNIFIVILAYKNIDETKECLLSLDLIKHKNFSVNVVLVNNDKATKFEEKDFITNLRNFPLRIINSKENTGFSGGNNVGIKYALEHNADYMLILNNDTFVDKELVEELYKSMEKQDQVGIACPKIYFTKGYEFHKDRYTKEELGKIIWYAGGMMDWKNVIGSHRGVDEVDNGQYDKEDKTEIATGCCMLIKREIFEKIGLFDEKYFLYYEDSDFSIRTKEHNFSIIFNPKAYIWHKNASSTGGAGSALQDYFITRNRMLFGMKYAPIRSKISLIRESFRLLINGRSWQKRGVIDYYVARFGKGSFKHI